ncbi:MAG: N-acetylmuramoyl-L-alanine amidase [Negativicutes bacterium]
MSGKKMILWLGLVCMFVAAPVHAVAASILPVIGDTKNGVEQQYGPAYVVQEDKAHFWTDTQWAEQNKMHVQVKAYGYPFWVRDFNSTLWIEYDRQNRVAKETLLFDGNIKIRNFEQHFPEMHTEMTDKDNATVVIRNYPQDQLAVRINADTRSERWVRFFFTGDDKTCINMHSKIRGFEIIEVFPDAIKDLMKLGKAVGCQFNGKTGEFPADGTWQRTDNYFLPQLYFSERLILRKGTDLIVIHHAAMPVDTSRADIHELHLTNGWAGVGYQKLVFANGVVENGRPEQMVGAHAYGANQHSLGIVLVGDFRKVRPTHVQLGVAAQLTMDFVKNI